MPRYNGVPRKLSPELLGQRHATRYRPRLPLLVVVASLTMVSLACAFIGTRSPDRIVVRTRLPTLTRTRLPTFTPTVISTPVAAAMVAEAADAAPTMAPVEPAVAPEDAIATLPSLSAATPVPVEAFDTGQASGSTNVTAVDPTLVQAEVPTTNPIDTPTGPPTAAATEMPLPTSTPTATATETPQPTSTPTSTPLPQDWLFEGVQVNPNPAKAGLLLYGNLINNTGEAQELTSITGTFYDVQGQLVAGSESTKAYWPGYVIPPGESMPFELVVNDIFSFANFDLSVKSEPSDETPRRDFEFAEVNQWMETDDYCIESTLLNRGGRLEEYVVIAAVLYDSQGQVINFSDYGEFGIGVGNDGQIFEICVGPPNQAVARYELQAWGR